MIFGQIFGSYWGTLGDITSEIFFCHLVGLETEVSEY